MSEPPPPTDLPALDAAIADLRAKYARTHGAGSKKVAALDAQLNFVSSHLLLHTASITTRTEKASYGKHHS